MAIEYVSQLKNDSDTVDLYTNLEWYQMEGYTDDDISKANESFYSIYAYDDNRLIGLGRVASDGFTAAVMSGICVRRDYRRHGIGAEIVNRLTEYCQSGDYSMDVRLFCEDSLIKWYEGLGFIKIAVGMVKPKPVKEEHCALKKLFGEIYGIEQIADVAPDFFWFNFDSYGDFRYYSGRGSEGAKVPFISMIFYSNEPVKFNAEIIFENVSEFEIGCKGVRTPLMGFDIVNTEKFGYSEKKRYKIRSLEDDDITFYCEKFRIMSVNTYEGVVQSLGIHKSRSDEEQLLHANYSEDDDAGENYSAEDAPAAEDAAEAPGYSYENDGIGPLPEIVKISHISDTADVPAGQDNGSSQTNDGSRINDGYGDTLAERLGLW
ncbi:MAG: GNAT family N-acetyltransferase [Huintestinicola sp.]